MRNRLFFLPGLVAFLSAHAQNGQLWLFNWLDRCVRDRACCPTFRPTVVSGAHLFQLRQRFSPAPTYF